MRLSQRPSPSAAAQSNVASLNTLPARFHHISLSLLRCSLFLLRPLISSVQYPIHSSHPLSSSLHPRRDLGDSSGTQSSFVVDLVFPGRQEGTLLLQVRASAADGGHSL